MLLVELRSTANMPSFAEHMIVWIKDNYISRTFLECPHDKSYVITKMTDRIGRVHYRQRCVYCVHMIKALKHVDALEMLDGDEPYDDDDFKNDYDYFYSTYKFDKKLNLKELRKKQFIFDCQKENEFNNYRQRYMQSQRWWSLRAVVFKRDNNQCQRCYTREYLECHHLHYRTFGAEAMTDLMTLCHECHKYVHANKAMIRGLK